MSPSAKNEESHIRVAAAETGPGPGTYMLPPVVGPTTAANKDKAPQWSIKLPLKTKYNDAPAPGYLPGDNKLPAVTVKGRNFYNPKKLVTPAPNYKNESSFKYPQYNSAPAYSMGTRSRYRKMDQVPPSTAYTLPSLVGAKNTVSKSEPVWNMSFVKPDHTSYSYDATKGPGPAAYNTQNTDSYRKKQPLYSFGARFDRPKDKTVKPGPGSYNPQKARGAPKFSMGVRHSQFVLPVLTAADLHLY